MRFEATSALRVEIVFMGCGVEVGGFGEVNLSNKDKPPVVANHRRAR